MSGTNWFTFAQSQVGTRDWGWMKARRERLGVSKVEVAQELKRSPKYHDFHLLSVARIVRRIERGDGNLKEECDYCIALGDLETKIKRKDK